MSTGIYLDAKKMGTEYYWTTGAKAYFTTSDVTNAGAGDCAYGDKSSNSIHGTDCNSAYNVICQSSKFRRMVLLCFFIYWFLR